MNYTIFNEDIITNILIFERKRTHISITDLAKESFISTATISRYENTKGLSYLKVKSILDYFHLTEDFINKGRFTFSNSINDFIINILAITSNIEFLYNKIKKDYAEFENSFFQICLDFIDLIYFSYINDFNNLSNLTVQSIIDNLELFSIEYKSLCQIYIGRYFYQMRDYEKAYSFLKVALGNCNDNRHLALLYYFLSQNCLKQNEFFLSLQYSEIAVSLFQKIQLYNRLINCNILLANQYRHVKKYNRALEIDLLNYKTIESNKDLAYERNIVANNIAWTYLLTDDFHHALTFLQAIQGDYKKNSHYFDEALCYFMLDDHNKASHVCKKGLKNNKGEVDVFLKLLDWMNKYINTPNLSKDTTQLVTIYNNYVNVLTIDENVYILKLIISIYQTKKQYSKALEYSLKIIELDRHL